VGGEKGGKGRPSPHAMKKRKKGNNAFRVGGEEGGGKETEENQSSYQKGKRKVKKRGTKISLNNQTKRGGGFDLPGGEKSGTSEERGNTGKRCSSSLEGEKGSECGRSTRGGGEKQKKRGKRRAGLCVGKGKGGNAVLENLFQRRKEGKGRERKKTRDGFSDRKKKRTPTCA